MTARDDFRAGVRAALEARLTPRDAGDTFTVLGAGRDDLEAGRAYLRALADGGWAVPTWPANIRRHTPVVRNSTEKYNPKPW